MKRFHVHVGVRTSGREHSLLFRAVRRRAVGRKADYAKWMIEDPRINFAISNRGGRAGVNHLGLQADSDDELRRCRRRLAAAGRGTWSESRDVSCCYAKSDKYWVTDPQGIAWESYHTLGEIPSSIATPAKLGRRQHVAHRRKQPRRAAAARRKPPGRRRPYAAVAHEGRAAMMRASRPWNVLFLCTCNSARSILAEVLLNRLGEWSLQGLQRGKHADRTGQSLSRSNSCARRVCRSTGLRARAGRVRALGRTGDGFRDHRLR